jgi:hypothetical protein
VIYYLYDLVVIENEYSCSSITYHLLRSLFSVTNLQIRDNKNDALNLIHLISPLNAVMYLLLGPMQLLAVLNCVHIFLEPTIKIKCRLRYMSSGKLITLID